MKNAQVIDHQLRLLVGSLVEYYNARGKRECSEHLSSQYQTYITSTSAIKWTYAINWTKSCTNLRKG